MTWDTSVEHMRWRCPCSAPILFVGVLIPCTEQQIMHNEVLGLILTKKQTKNEQSMSSIQNNTFYIYSILKLSKSNNYFHSHDCSTKKLVTLWTNQAALLFACMQWGLSVGQHNSTDTGGLALSTENKEGQKIKILHMCTRSLYYTYVLLLSLVFQLKIIIHVLGTL